MSSFAAEERFGRGCFSARRVSFIRIGDGLSAHFRKGRESVNLAAGDTGAGSAVTTSGRSVAEHSDLPGGVRWAERVRAHSGNAHG